MDLKASWRAINIHDMMIAALLILIFYNTARFGSGMILPIATVAAAAAILDIIIVYARGRKIFFPKSAVISSLILGLIIQGPLHLLAAVSMIAILSKHVIRIRGRHIFNPANLALLVALFLPVSHSWWGTSEALLVGLMGLLIVYKMRRYHMALPFLGLHVLFMLLVFYTQSTPYMAVGHILSGPVLFFTFYMLIEPMTAPVTKHSRIIFGALVGMVGALLYVAWLPAMLVGALFFANLCAPIFNRVHRHN